MRLTASHFGDICKAQNRDIPAFCTYFATYETLRSLVKNEDGEVGVMTTAVIGAISGVLGWAVELPADNVKNSYQVSLGQRSLRWTVRDILAQGGIRQLYRWTEITFHSQPLL